MEYLADRIRQMSESATLAMARKSRELKEKGIDIISLSLGEPDFDTPGYVKEAAKKAIDDNYSKYPPVSGYSDLKSVISEKFSRENNLSYTPDQIVVSAGGKHSIINVILSIVNPGDEVIILAPYWVSYYDQILLAGGKPVIINTSIENDFKVSPEQLEVVITPKTRLMIFNSPSNPTGMVYSEEEMSDLVKIISRHPGLFVLSDEIYEHILFEGRHISIGTYSSISERVITVNGVSKGYAMTGWRIGYIGAPLWIAKAVDKLQGQFTSGVCSIAQRAALAALKSDDGSRKFMNDAFRRRRDLVCSLLKEIKGMKIRVPQGAFYVMPDISYFLRNSESLKSGDDLALYILEKAGVATVGGDAFGSPSCIRISYATSDDLLTEAVRRMKVALSDLK